MKKIVPMEGLILKSSDYKEQAVIVDIFTKEGLKSYIIKGAKKLSGGTRLLSTPLTLINFNATESEGLNTLTEGNIKNNYIEIKQNINKMMIAYPILEKLLTFTSQVTEPNTFYTFTLSILDLLSQDLDEYVILSLFELKLTYLIGIEPQLNSCVKCQKPVINGYLNIEQGGIICPSCATFINKDLDNEKTKLFKLLYLVKLNKVDKAFIDLFKGNIRELNKVIDDYYQRHLDFVSKAKQITKKII